MYEGVLKLEANDQGVWISALKEDISQSEALACLRENGVRKYDMKLLEEFLRLKSRSPFRIAPRDPLQEKDAQMTMSEFVSKGKPVAPLKSTEPKISKDASYKKLLENIEGE